MSNKIYVPGFPGPVGDAGVLPAFRSRGFSGGGGGGAPAKPAPPTGPYS